MRKITGSNMTGSKMAGSNMTGPTRARKRRPLAMAIIMSAMAAGAVASPGDRATASPPMESRPVVTPLSLPSAGGGSLGSLTVEDTSRARIRFERPALSLDLDPLTAPGLACESALAIVDRQRPDLALPLLQASAGERAVRTPCPWLTAFTVGTLVRLRQDVAGATQWQLEIVDAHGAVVCTRAGEGTPPREIAWDGLRGDGTPAPCGLAYSHVLTARDKAGNTRRFVGDSFELPPYRVDGTYGPCLLFSATQWRASFGAFGDGRGVSALLTDAATVLNLGTDPGRALVVTATATEAETAEEIGRDIIAALAPQVGGGDRRLELRTLVVAGSPDGGTVQVAPRIVP